MGHISSRLTPVGGSIDSGDFSFKVLEILQNQPADEREKVRKIKVKG